MWKVRPFIGEEVIWLGTYESCRQYVQDMVAAGLSKWGDFWITPCYHLSEVV